MIAKQAEAAIINLKIIETLTYNCQNLEALVTLNSNLSEALEKLTEIPNSEGLCVRQEIVRQSSAKSKRIHRLVQQKRYGSLKLQIKRGRKRQDSKYRNRVGARAN